MTCEGRIAIITGAAGRGMGRSIALTLAREGASVVINYRRSAEAAAELVDRIQSRGQEAISVRADVMSLDDCKRLIDETVTRFGRVDICIVNPGSKWRPGPIHQIDPTDSVSDVAAETTPLFNLIPLVLPRMYEQRWGRLIALSLAQGEAITPGHGFSYCVGKAARTHAIRMARDQAWEHGVTVNVLAPGPVTTIGTLDEALEQCDQGPGWVGRKTTSPQDVAEGIAFLCSEAARFVTGAQICYGFRLQETPNECINQPV